MTAILVAYCACASCCGPWSPEAGGPGRTASGSVATPFRTIAAPPSVPFGSWVEVTCPELGWSGKRFRVEDRTKWRNPRVWDVFVGHAPGDHQRAKKMGRHEVEIRVLGKDSR